MSALTLSLSIVETLNPKFSQVVIIYLTRVDFPRPGIPRGINTRVVGVVDFDASRRERVNSDSYSV